MILNTPMMPGGVPGPTMMQPINTGLAPFSWLKLGNQFGNPGLGTSGGLMTTGSPSATGGPIPVDGPHPGQFEFPGPPIRPGGPMDGGTGGQIPVDGPNQFFRPQTGGARGIMYRPMGFPNVPPAVAARLAQNVPWARGPGYGGM